MTWSSTCWWKKRPRCSNSRATSPVPTRPAQAGGTAIDTLARWHDIVRQGDFASLRQLLADDCVFHSPVLHTPQQGRALTAAYLAAAMQVLGNGTFRYVRQLVAGRDAVLEFEAELDGIHINGVDLIHWNDDGRISDFKVMVRPLKAVNLLQQKMAAALAERGGPL